MLLNFFGGNLKNWIFNFRNASVRFMFGFIVFVSLLSILINEILFNLCFIWAVLYCFDNFGKFQPADFPSKFFYYLDLRCFEILQNSFVFNFHILNVIFKEKENFKRLLGRFEAKPLEFIIPCQTAWAAASAQELVWISVFGQKSIAP